MSRLSLHPAAELGDAIKGAELLEVALVGCHQGGLKELGAPDACVGILGERAILALHLKPLAALQIPACCRVILKQLLTALDARSARKRRRRGRLRGRRGRRACATSVVMPATRPNSSSRVAPVLSAPASAAAPPPAPTLPPTSVPLVRRRPWRRAVAGSSAPHSIPKQV